MLVKEEWLGCLWKDLRSVEATELHQTERLKRRHWDAGPCFFVIPLISFDDKRVILHSVIRCHLMAWMHSVDLVMACERMAGAFLLSQGCPILSARSHTLAIQAEPPGGLLSSHGLSFRMVLFLSLQTQRV